MAGEIEGLRVKLAGMSGPVRTHTLYDLARLLADRYWRTGPGKREALPDLNEAIEALTEAYGYFQPDDALRSVPAGQLGWLLAMRHGVHQSGKADREAAIRLLVEALAHPGIQPVTAPPVRLTLGQMYLSRVTGGAVDGMLRLAVRPGSGSAAQRADADRAADCFRQVLAMPNLDPKVAGAAEALLTFAEAARSVFGGVSSFDPAAMARAAQTMRRLWKDGLPGVGGHGIFQARGLADMDPLDRPVVVVEGADEPPVPRPAPPRPRPAAPTTGADEVRLALRKGFGGGDDAFAAAGPLLAEGAPRPDVATTDELVALATTVVHGDAAGATDHLLLAAALLMRARTDTGAGADDDAEAALECVRTAAADLAALPPSAFALLLRLGLLLAGRDATGSVAGATAGIAAALRRVGADALACPQLDGMVLLHAATGRVSFGSPRGLPRRVIVTGDEPPAAGIAIVSTVASHTQLLELSRRRRRPVFAEPVFLAGPDADTARLRQCYSRGEILTGGTAWDVLARLGASLLHLSGTIGPGGGLRLAGRTELTAEAVAAARPTRAGGGLVVLPAAGAAFVALADAFLAAGFTGAVGWLRPVPPAAAATVHLELHSRLARERQEPASAVHSVRRWLRTSASGTPPGPRELAAALTYRGV